METSVVKKKTKLQLNESQNRDFAVSRYATFSKKFGSLTLLWSVLIDLDVEETVGLSSRCVAHMSADVSHVILMPSAAL